MKTPKEIAREIVKRFRQGDHVYSKSGQKMKGWSDEDLADTIATAITIAIQERTNDDPVDSTLPSILKPPGVIVTLNIKSTNYNTCRYALEHLVERMKGGTLPKGMPNAGEAIEDQYWRLTVQEKRHPLDEARVREMPI